MKKRFLIFIGLLLFTAAELSAQEPTNSYVFDRTAHDFGVLKTNQTGTAVFNITNNGTTPLVILDVKVSCDCAKIEWPRQPILPGGSAGLTVTYKDKDVGAFYKVIEVTTNGTPRRSQIRLKGSIER